MSFLNFSSMQRHNLNRILLFGLVWFCFAFIYVLLQKSILVDTVFYPGTKNKYFFSEALITTLPSGFLIGIIFGTIEVVFLKNLFSKNSFGKKIFFKTIIYGVILLILIALAVYFITSFTLNKSIFHKDVIASSLKYLQSVSFLFVILYGVITFGFSLFILGIKDYLGQGVLLNFLTGKYHKPKEENRIFMFLDMKDSTTIAEKLGHVKYYELLNEYYADMTKVILKTSGKIYQYVGDEIIVSWKLNNSDNSIKCFFLLKKVFDEIAPKYKSSFDLVPSFKAGYHCGTVTTGEIGVIKKEIVFTGDVLNTTSRIQGMCNTYNTNLLVSSDYSKLLDTTKYNTEKQGEINLKGKVSKTQLYTISKI